jgi:hypothetical protein
MAAMPELRLEERVISPGVFQFSVSNGVELERVAERLKTLSIAGSNGLQVLKLSPDELVVVLR